MIFYFLQNKQLVAAANVAASVVQDVEAKLTQMVCSLENKDECLSCGA